MPDRLEEQLVVPFSQKLNEGVPVFFAQVAPDSTYGPVGRKSQIGVHRQPRVAARLADLGGTRKDRPLLSAVPRPERGIL